MTDSSPVLQSIAVLAAFALVWGGIVLIRRERERQKGVLMIVAAFVLLANLLIWAWPMANAG